MFFIGREIQGIHMWTGGTRGLGGHKWTGGTRGLGAKVATAGPGGRRPPSEVGGAKRSWLLVPHSCVIQSGQGSTYWDFITLQLLQSPASEGQEMDGLDCTRRYCPTAQCSVQCSVQRRGQSTAQLSNYCRCWALSQRQCVGPEGSATLDICCQHLGQIQIQGMMSTGAW
jgi:hypothetical protein